MRTLYHFQTSPFSRRTRLALAHKGLEVELREARSNPAFHDEARKLWPLRTIPVLVEGDGRVMGDSTAIAHYLDAEYPKAPRLWPEGGDALRSSLECVELVNGALNLLVDVGTRYHALKGSPEWNRVRDEMVGRAQGALSALGERTHATGPRPLTSAGWCVADIWLFVAVAWLESLPARASQSPNVAQIVSLPWSLPASLSRWAEAFRHRDDVRALDPLPERSAQ